MRVKNLKNISNEKIVLKLGGCVETILPPGADISDVIVFNCLELEDKAVIAYDLTEVNENQKKTRIDG